MALQQDKRRKKIAAPSDDVEENQATTAMPLSHLPNHADPAAAGEPQWQDGPMGMVWDQMKMTLLCMNRILEEPALSRKIAGDHKDLLMDQVTTRLQEMEAELIETHPRPDVLGTDAASVCREVIHYVTYYKTRREIILNACNVCAKMTNHGEYHDCMPLLIERIGGILLSFFDAHPEQDPRNKFLFWLLVMQLKCPGPRVDEFVDEALAMPCRTWMLCESCITISCCGGPKVAIMHGPKISDCCRQLVDVVATVTATGTTVTDSYRINRCYCFLVFLSGAFCLPTLGHTVCRTVPNCNDM